MVYLFWMETPQMIYGTAWKKDQTSSCVERALQAGFRAFDTANQPKHYFEQGLGDGLKDWIFHYGRDGLFIQTKFTPLNGQDHRVPYDGNANIADQVVQSFESSCEHLGTDWIDSVLLHGPYHHPGLGTEDYEVWRSMEHLWTEHRVGHIGVCNVNALQLAQLIQNAKIHPHIVQNRVYAVRNWDKEVRDVCREHGVVYQGFSLLTANPQVVSSNGVATIASKRGWTPEQVIFAFARATGIVPITGTTNAQHMVLDLEAIKVDLDPAEVALVER